MFFVAAGGGNINGAGDKIAGVGGNIARDAGKQLFPFYSDRF